MSCRFDRLSIYCVFIYYFNVCFPKDSEYDIRLSEKSIIKIYSTLEFINPYSIL